MSSIFKRSVLAVAALAACASASQAAVVVKTYTSTDPYAGFMNVFELPANGGGYVFGSNWGIPDLRATLTPTSVTLKANAINDPNPFWYTPAGGPGAAGNKIMEANLYVDAGAAQGVTNGDTVTFAGIVSSNTLVPGYSAIAFVKDFAPDFSSSVTQTVPLTPGAFSVTLPTIADPARHIQYGFQLTGADAWITDADAKGSVVVGATLPVPEPASLAALGVAGVTLAVRRRRVAR